MNKTVGYVGVYSAEEWEDNHEARCIRNTLHAARVRVRYGHSIYVAHKLIEIAVEDLRRAAKVLRAEGYGYVAQCARRTLRDLRAQGVRR